MKASGQKPLDSVRITTGELAALLIQSVLFASATGLLAAILGMRLFAWPRPLAFGAGLELGLLLSYPTIRLVGRANGAQLGFGKWAAMTMVPTILAVLISSVF